MFNCSSEHCSWVCVSERVLVVRVRRCHLAGGRVEVVGSAAPLAHVPLIEVGNLRREVRRRAVPVLWLFRAGRKGVSQCVRGGNVGGVCGGGRRWRLAVYFHVLAQRARVRVGLVTAAHLAVVRLVTSVNVRVLLPVAAVGEFPVTAVKLAFERLFTLNEGGKRQISASP